MGNMYELTSTKSCQLAREQKYVVRKENELYTPE